MAIFVEGLGDVQIVNNEYTHPDIAREYKTQLAILTDIYARRPSVTNLDPETEFSAADYNAIVNALTALRQLASDGLDRNVVLGNPDSPIETFFLTTQMAQNLDLLVRSLKLAEITVPPTLVTDAEKKTAVLKWIDLAGFGVAEILQSAVNAGINNRSIQSLIELEYVKTGNDVISEALGDLEDALGITKDVLDTLEKLQGIRNQVAVRSLLTLVQFIRIFHSGLLLETEQTFFGEDWVVRYSQALGSYIKLVIPSFTGDTANLPFSILNLKAKLRSHLLQLEAVSPDNNRNIAGTLAFNLNQLVTTISTIFTDADGVTPLDALSTTASLKQAAIDFLLIDLGEEHVPVAEIPGVFASIPGISTHIRSMRGDDFSLENSISTSITSAESLNDTQKQEVRRYLFLFEEFYKSASAVLTKVSQLIEKFAQNIAR